MRAQIAANLKICLTCFLIYDIIIVSLNAIIFSRSCFVLKLKLKMIEFVFNQLRLQ